MSGIWGDVRFGLRVWRRNPGFAAVSALTLALGIGLTTAIFSFVNAVLFRPLPVADIDELVGVYNAEPGSFISHEPLAYPDYVDLRDGTTALRSLAGYATVPFALERGDESEMIFGEAVSGNYFSTLGVQPIHGRALHTEDDTPGAAAVAVLNHATWQSRFGADPSVVGRELRLNGRVFTIVGVAPPGFNGMIRALQAEAWVPTATLTQLRGSAKRLTDRKSRWFWAIGRLAPEATFAKAGAELAGIGRGLQELYPDSNRNRNVTILPAADVKILPGVDTVLYATSFVLLGAVGIVLLIASANVANMLLARASFRSREMAVRLSLGVSRGRLVRQLLTESTLLAAAGGLLGLGLAFASNRMIEAIELPIPIKFALGLSLDFRVLSFAFVTATLTTLLFGLAPALQSARADVVSALKSEGATATGSRSRAWLRDGLVVGQVSLCLVLLIAAGLSVRSLMNASSIDPGFDPSGVALVSLDASLVGYDNEMSAALYEGMVEQLAAMPGVQEVTRASHLPLTFEIRTERMTPAGSDAGPIKEWPSHDSGSIAPGYFETLRIPILRGRVFSSADRGDAQLVVINEALAERFWPGEEAVGQMVRLEEEGPPAEVIGVVATARYRTLGEDPRPYLYQNLLQKPETSQVLIARTSGDPAALVPTLRSIVRAADRRVPMLVASSFGEAMGAALLLPRLGATLFGLFGVLGMLLAAVGLYGVMAYLVSRRAREMGIRMALGADRGQVLALVVRQGLARTFVGIGVGLLAAFGLTRAIAAILYGVSPTDPVTFVGVSLGLVGIATLASWIPARRAASVSPSVALRYE